MRSVCVISDLHLGGAYPVPPEQGKRGFRLCTHSDAIAQFIGRLSQRVAGGERIELVLNGDTVDFLAESDAPNTWSAFTADPEQAVKKFTAIVERDPAVFKELGTFVESGGRLVLLLGNHDIELSLPRVREALRQAIGIRAHHDFEFLYDGEAYTIGDALIEHGNRYDSWNQVNYDALRRVRSLQSRQQIIPEEEEFPTPVGSRMVISVINPIKGEYAFIDLLKPETDVVLPMLLALEPGYRTLIATLALLYKETRKYGVVAGALPKIGGHIRSERAATDILIGQNISSSGSSASRSSGSDQEQALRDSLKRVLGKDAEHFLRDIDAQIDAHDPLKGLGSPISFTGQVKRALGLAKLLVSGKSQAVQQRLPSLLAAMRVIQDLDTFNVGKEAATEYLEAARDLTKRDFRYVIFGHTHLAKQVSLGDGRFYFNSGTWADMLQFPASILQAPTEDEALRALESFVADMQVGNFSKWTLFNPHYVWLEFDDAGKVAKAELRTVSVSPSAP